MRLAAFIVAFAAAIAFTAMGNSYYVFIMATLGLTALVGIGLNVLLGLTGQVSFGHVGFYALGAYAVAILTVGLKWSFWAALPVAAVVSGLVGALLGSAYTQILSFTLVIVALALMPNGLFGRAEVKKV